MNPNYVICILLCGGSRELHFGRAAALSASQPPLSQQMQILEQQIKRDYWRGAAAA